MYNSADEKNQGKKCLWIFASWRICRGIAPAARVTAMETDSEDPKFPDARAAETPESASVDHLATRSTDQEKGKAVQLTETVWVLLLEPRALLHQREI
ncbi:uncharacterized protein LOC112004420 isoform X1 [Quercus suber]|uniref:uncharacterized protein LOC112004420 isoform X1 n=1 Tax=Quercus suber TaxID=58331 RepID=UPI0032DF7026